MMSLSLMMRRKTGKEKRCKDGVPVDFVDLCQEDNLQIGQGKMIWDKKTMGGGDNEEVEGATKEEENEVPVIGTVDKDENSTKITTREHVSPKKIKN